MKRSARIYRNKPRRGMLLLAVLSFLVLFLLIGTTFLVVANQYRQGAERIAARATVGDKPEKLVNEAIMQLLRDTRGPLGSSLYPHSLLRDVYGGSIRAVASAPQNESSGQILRVSVAQSAGGPALRQEAGYYNGCVITFLEGNAAGRSAHIIDYQPGFVRIEMPLNDAGSPITAFGVNQVACLINGRPFSGAGLGYDLTTYARDQQALGVPSLTGIPVAYLPHLRVYANDNTYIQGGVNESRDTADFDDMYMALVTRDLNGNVQSIIPSFHRPELLRYLQQTGQLNGNDVLLASCLRPTRVHHPNFTGSNPAHADAAATNLAGVLPILTSDDPRLLDVDSDGDGIPDSIWIDLGFPVKTSSDGRLYKPLFAFHVVDMDGKLNINVAGNLTQGTTPVVNGLGYVPGNPDLSMAPRGSGMGPAELSLDAVLGGQAVAVIQTRYGQGGMPGLPDASFRQRMLFMLKEPGLREIYGNPAVPSSYGSPSDITGQVVTAIDHAGQAFYPNGGVMMQELGNSPYVFNVVQPQGVDAAFVEAELERILRRHDADARTLPNRLADLIVGSNLPITVRSMEIPVPAGHLPPELRGVAQQPTIYDLFAARLQAGGATNIPDQIQTMLAWELTHGERMNLNRLWGDGQTIDAYGLNMVDTPYVATTSFFAQNAPGDFLNGLGGSADVSTLAVEPTMARQLYARHLYCLMMFLIDQNYTTPFNEPGLDAVAARELTARRVAQWAINAANFRANDSIMTPFEYDVNPFNGWDVDGTLQTTNDSPDRRLVWGCVAPELIITETLVTHDKGLKDSDLDDGGGEKRLDDDGDEADEHLDQFRIPMANLFVELRSMGPRNHNNPNPPNDLYVVNGGVNYLDLGRRAAAVSGDGIQYPVWRLAISEWHGAMNQRTNQNSPRQRQQANWDTISYQPANSIATMALEQMTDLPSDGNDNLLIERVVWFTDGGGNVPGPPAHPEVYYNRTAGGGVLLPAGQYALVGPRPITHFGSTVAAPFAPSTQKLRLLAGAVEHTQVDGTVHTPLVTVNPQVLTIVAAADVPNTPGWDDAQLTQAGIGINATAPLVSSGNYYQAPTFQLPDFPYKDAYGDPEGGDPTFPDLPFDYEDDMPLREMNMVQTDHYPDFKTVFLQRLANPHIAYDPVTNPYITVDWMPLDANVYNGDDREPADWAPKQAGTDFDPQDPEQETAAQRFQSRQRGSLNSANNLWAQISTDPIVTAEALADGENFRHNLMHTFGYLNNTYPVNTLTAPAEHVGDPEVPTPWITWHNRPYANHLELLLVPSSSPQRLLHEFSTASVTNPYNTNAFDNVRAPYAHLLNFFHSDSNGGGQGANFYRLLDYVEVPSRFAGTEKWFNPGADVAPQRRVPYNRVSAFRSPGKINPNTITDERVWLALFNGNPPVSFAEFVASRQGFGAGGASDYPTSFANPFRSGTGSDLMPPLASGGQWQTGAQATLLRGSPNNPNQPLFARTTGAVHNDPERHAYFYYENLSRLGNSVTTQSNVYAVWLTVGYFEVEPAGVYNSIYPDGYRLGQELHSDTGQVKRHRAFYMIDRSIPVAFEPGENHNVEKAIILKRMID